eukprot:13910952-Ditylum_brightwellii.AAC.1
MSSFNPSEKLMNSTNLRHCRDINATVSSGHQLILTSSLLPIAKAPAAYSTVMIVTTKNLYRRNITAPYKLQYV